MKHLKKFKIFESEEPNNDSIHRTSSASLSNFLDKEDSEMFVDFDFDFAMTKIKEHFSNEKVTEMFDKEMLEWVDSDWNDSSKSAKDWYVKNGNGEAEDIVITDIINWYKSNYELLEETEGELSQKISEEFKTFLILTI